MEIILLQKINKLGNMGDTVKVKPGFGRNFLIPSGKALRASKENKEILFAEFGEIIFPFYSFGQITTIDLFGIDELIIFATET